jgi:hypothetical protein
MRKLIIIIVLQLISIQISFGQVNYCNDSLKTEDLIGKKVKIYSFSPTPQYDIEGLFDSTIILKLVKNYSELNYQNFNGKNAVIVDVSKGKTKYSAKRIFVVKVNNAYIPLDCSLLIDTNGLDLDQCHKKYDSIYKPYNKNCFLKIDDGDWVDYAFQNFVCSLKYSGVDTILAFKRWGAGDIYANIASFVIWVKDNQCYIKGFWKRRKYDCGYYDSRGIQPVYETEILKYGNFNFLQFFSVNILNSYKKAKDYNSVHDMNLRSLDIWLNIKNNTNYIFYLSEAYFMKKCNDDPDNDFFKLYKYLYGLYSTWKD